MGLLDRAFERRSTEMQLSLRDPALREIFGGGSQTTAGIRINQATAMRIGAVYACVNAISQDMAKMPYFVYEDQGEKGSRKAIEHPLYRILKSKPNPYMTSFVFRQLMQAWLLTWGNAFAEIERDNAGKVIALWPWRPDRVRMRVVGKKLYYLYLDPDGGEIPYSQDEVLHLRGLGDDGICGYSVIALHRESLGLCQASLEYRARFFANDARPGGVLEHPGALSDLAKKNLRESIYGTTGGKDQRSFAILEEGMKWHDVGIPPNDAQYIEGWEAGKKEIAALFRVPPYKIGILEPGTVSHSSVEQASLDYYQDCLLAWIILWEQTVDGTMFTDAEGRRFYTKLNADHILRADSLTRAQVLQIWRRNGILNADEWRGKEEMNPLPGGEGKTYVIEAAMQRLDQVGQQPQKPDAGAPALLNGAAKPAPQLTNGVAH